MSESRPEDRNARETWRAFEDGATLAELEEFTADMRRRGAPGDARPRAALNGQGEITGIVCVTERDPTVLHVH